MAIPKEDGSERHLGILFLEDKVVQQAVGEILSQIYEVDFLGFVYGFRRGRGQQAEGGLWACPPGVCQACPLRR